jgi:hypothetical protein
LYGLINQYGDVIVPPAFNGLKMSEGNFIPFKKDGKWGYISKVGNINIKNLYDNCWPFSGMAARVKNDGSYFYIDKGNKKISQEYLWAGDFINNFAMVMNRDSSFDFVNRKFEVVSNLFIPQVYNWLEPKAMASYITPSWNCWKNKG